MTERRPIVIVGNTVSELPQTDTLPSAAVTALEPLIKITGAFGMQFDAGRDASLFHANSGYHTLMAH